MIKVETLLKNEMTQDIINKHDVKTYFSGKTKQIGDKFTLGMLLIPDLREDLEIIFDFCDRDIEEDLYFLEKVKVSGVQRLGYFKLNYTNDQILENLNESIEKTEIEYHLENMKDRIEMEISKRRDKRQF